MILNWSAFISTHPDSVNLTTNQSNLVNIFETSEDAITRDKMIARLSAIASTPSTTVLTLNPFGNQIHTSFFHQPFGIDMAGTKPVQCICLTGLTTKAIPVLLDANNLLSQTTTAVPCPSLAALMSLHDQDLATVTALGPSDDTTAHIKLAAVLPPSLSSIITGPLEHESTQHLIHTFTKTIFATKPEDTAADDWTFATDFHPILLTLWAFLNHATIPNLHTPTAAACSTEALEWADSIHTAHLSQHPSDASNSTISSTSSTILNQLADKINRSPTTSTRFASSPEEPKEDEKQKAWRKLDAYSKKGILFASSTDGITTPDLPTEKFLQILTCKNGAAVIRLFLHWYPRLDLIIQPGMATNMYKGIYTSVPDPFAVNTFSPFFTPPARAGFCNTSNDELNLLELSSTTLNLSEARIKQMTTSKPFLELNSSNFLPTMKNYEAVVTAIFGQDSLLALPISDLVADFTDNELHYYRCFQQFKCFGLWLTDRIHFHQQAILHECHSASNIEDVKFHSHNLQHELKEIKMMTFQASVPTWCEPIIKESNNKNSRLFSELDTNTAPGGAGKEKDRRPNKKVKVENPTPDQAVLLKSHETYSKLVHFKNIQQCSHLSVQINGKYACNNYHIRGHCHAGCPRASTHIQLTGQDKTNFRSFVTALRAAAKDFSRTRSTTNQEGEN